MSNEKPLKLDMTFKEALQMIARGGKPDRNPSDGAREEPKGDRALAGKRPSRVQSKKVK